MKTRLPSVEQYTLYPQFSLAVQLRLIKTNCSEWFSSIEFTRRAQGHLTFFITAVLGQVILYLSKISKIPYKRVKDGNVLLVQLFNKGSSVTSENNKAKIYI